MTETQASTKPEVHNVLQGRQKEDRGTAADNIHIKLGKVETRGS